MRKYLLIPAALILAGCGTATPSEPEPSPAAVEDTFTPPEPISLDGQTFEYTTLDGAKGTLTIPSEPEPSMHEFLTLTGQAADKTYAKVDVDNREGFVDYSVYDINLYTPEGDVVTFHNLNNSFTDLNLDVPAEHVDAYYATPDAEDVAVGQRADNYAITDQPIPDEVTRIEIGQTGGGSVQVYPEVPADQMTSAETQQEWMDQQ